MIDSNIFLPMYFDNSIAFNNLFNTSSKQLIEFTLVTYLLLFILIYLYKSSIYEVIKLIKLPENLEVTSKFSGSVKCNYFIIYLN